MFLPDFQQIQRMLEPTTRQNNKYNMLAYSWKMKFYDTLHITEKVCILSAVVNVRSGTKGGDFFITIVPTRDSLPLRN